MLLPCLHCCWGCRALEPWGPVRHAISGRHATCPSAFGCFGCRMAPWAYGDTTFPSDTGTYKINGSDFVPTSMMGNFLK